MTSHRTCYKRSFVKFSSISVIIRLSFYQSFSSSVSYCSVAQIAAGFPSLAGLIFCDTSLNLSHFIRHHHHLCFYPHHRLTTRYVSFLCFFAKSLPVSSLASPSSASATAATLVHLLFLLHLKTYLKLVCLNITIITTTTTKCQFGDSRSR